MNTVKAGNRSAYPFDQEDISDIGLTKRELFAAMALQGLVASDSTLPYLSAAAFAVKYADALIDALNTEVV